MPTQTVNSMSRSSSDDLFLFRKSESEVMQALLQDDLWSSARQRSLRLCSVHPPVFGQTYPQFAFLYIYIYVDVQLKAEVRMAPLLAKRVTSVNNRYACDCVIQAHAVPRQRLKLDYAHLLWAFCVCLCQHCKIISEFVLLYAEVLHLSICFIL